MISRCVTFLLSVITTSPAVFPLADPYQPAEVSPALHDRVIQATDLRKDGRGQSAVQELEAIVNQNPRYFLAQYQLGLAYAATQRYDDAIARLRIAKNLNTELSLAEPTIANSLGDLYLTTGRRAEAVKELEEASRPAVLAKLDPSHRQIVFNNLARAYTGSGRSCEADLAFSLAEAAVKHPVEPVSSSDVAGYWKVDEWILANHGWALPRIRGRVHGTLSVTRRGSEEPSDALLALCVVDTIRGITYGVQQSMKVSRKGADIGMKGTILSGHNRWYADVLELRVKADVMTGKARDASGSDEVRFIRLWR